jgi:hypothetical protein
VVTDVFLRLNGDVIDVEPLTAYEFMSRSLEKGTFRFSEIRDWLASNVSSLEDV